MRIFWKDLNGVYLGYNRLFTHDISPEDNYDFIGKTDYDMPWKDEAQGYIDDDKLVFTSGKPKLNYEEQQTRSDGSTEWVSTSKVPLYNEEGEIIGTMGISRNISRMKELETQHIQVIKDLETALQRQMLASAFFLCDN